MRKLILIGGLLMLPLMARAQTCTRARTPFTSEIMTCEAAPGHRGGGVLRAIGKYGPWVLATAALAVALGRRHGKTVTIIEKPRKHRKDEE